MLLHALNMRISVQGTVKMITHQSKTLELTSRKFLYITLHRPFGQTLNKAVPIWSQTFHYAQHICSPPGSFAQPWHVPCAKKGHILKWINRQCLLFGSDFPDAICLPPAMLSSELPDMRALSRRADTVATSSSYILKVLQISRTASTRSRDNSY